MFRVNRLLGQVSPHTPTHTVLNQAKPFVDYNSYLHNARLRSCVQVYSRQLLGEGAELSDVSATALEKHGAACGSSEYLTSAEAANKQLPVFTPFDRFGNRINSVSFSDHWFKLLDLSFATNTHNYAWTTAGAEDPAAHIRRAAHSYMELGLESGHGCPTTMSFACYPVLAENNGGVYGDFTPWLQRLAMPPTHYDRNDVHISQKTGGIMIGMSMTEKQGGSDVRSNTTTAVRLTNTAAVSEGSAEMGGGYQCYSLTGHKWFTSAPMCDAFLTLANTEAGSTCFLVPRWVSPTERNAGLKFQRLKDKLGDRSNASSEVEYDQALGYLVGKEGQGIKTIMTMVGMTRLDCCLGSAGMMNVSLMHAINHARTRKAFGALLIDQPIMQNVLCDLALEAEAATALAMRMSRAVPQANLGGPLDKSFARIACAIAKYHICKTGPQFTYEAMECHGGNGYTDDYPLARHYRQAPVNPIWEGSGNVIVLDVFRALSKDSTTLKALEVEVLRSGHPTLIDTYGEIVAQLQTASPVEALMSGRWMVETLATILQGCALLETEEDPAQGRWIAEWFIESRLGSPSQNRRIGGGSRGRHFGTLNVFDREKGMKLLKRFFTSNKE